MCVVGWNRTRRILSCIQDCQPNLFKFPKQERSHHTARVAETLRTPGQPFTFSGVACYASARFGRLLGVALCFAVISAAVACVFAARAWWPVITEAVSA